MVNDDLTRFYMTNSSLRDSNGNTTRSSLKDWDKQVREMTKALESATNGIVRVIKAIDAGGNARATFDVNRDQSVNAQAVFNRVLADIETRYKYQAGSLAIAPYAQGARQSEDYKRITFHKSLHGSLAKKVAQEEVKTVGASIRADPSRKLKDRMEIGFAVSESEWDNALQKSKGDSSKARDSLVKAFSRRNLRESSKYSQNTNAEQIEKQKEAQNKKQKEIEARDKKEHKGRVLRWFTAITAVLTGIADITRRILTASLARGSEIKKESVDAKSLGISYTNMREYKAQETAMGMKEGTFIEAIASLQDAFGDITNLDENALSELAKVLHGDVLQAINAGLGKNDPEALMRTILNAYYKRGQNGVNSIGQQVGRYQAERELATALDKAGLPALSDILRSMFYTNDTGIYKGRISTEDSFADYMNLVTAYTMGFSGAENKHASELGAVIDSVKEKFEQLKENLDKLVLFSIKGLMDKIDNWDIGKSPIEKSDENITNLDLNKQAINRMNKLAKTARNTASALFAEAGISFDAFGEGATAEDAVNALNKVGWDVNDLPAPQRAIAESMIMFAKTEKGKNAIYSLLNARIAEDKAKKADVAIVEGREKGNISYDKAAYTDSAVQSAAKKAVEDFYSKESRKPRTIISDEFGGTVVVPYTMPMLGLLGAETSVGTTHDSKAIYKQLIAEYYGGNEVTYDEALASGNSTKLTQALYDKLPAAYKEKKGFLGFTLNGTKQEAVKKALAEGVLTQADVTEIMATNITKGYGFSNEQLKKVIKLFNYINALGAENVSGANIILTDALEQENAKRFMEKHNTDRVKATVSGYDEKTGTVRVILAVNKGGQEIKELISFYTDTVLGKEAKYEFDISDTSKIVNTSIEQGASR